MKLDGFVNNFTDKKRAHLTENGMLVSAPGKWYFDLIIALIVLVFIILGIRNAVLGEESATAIIICVLCLILYIAFATRGNNWLEIDLSNRALKVKRRSAFLSFIPKQTIPFNSIHSLSVKEFKHNKMHVHRVFAHKNKGLIKKYLLISFYENEKNKANELLSVLKKVIFS